MNNRFLANIQIIFIVLLALLFTCCNSFNNHQPIRVLSNKNSESYFPLRALNKNANSNGSEDTLCFKIDGIDFSIFPNGLLCWGISKNDTIRLTTDMFVAKAFFFKKDSSFFLLCEESDNDCGTSELYNVNLQEKKIKWKVNMGGFNLGQPIVRGDFVYFTTIGLVAKFDLERGKYVYKSSELYDRQKSAFNDFDTIIFKDNMTYFLSKRILTDIIDSVIVNEKTNKMTVKKPANNKLKGLKH